MTCPACGSSVVPGDLFCSSCGARLVGAAAEAGAAGMGGLAAVAAPVPPRRGRGVLYAVAGGVAALLVVAALVAYFVVLPRLTPSGFRTAQYAPRDAWVYATMTLRPGAAQLANLNSVVQAFTSQPGFDQALKAQQHEAQVSRLDLQQEVLPLLDGEISLVVWGSSSDPRGVLLAHSSDPEKLLRLIAEKGDGALLEPSDQYHGAPFSPLQAQGKQARSAAAAYKGWLIVGESEAAVKQTVDRVDADPKDSLAQNPRYTQLIQRLPEDRLGFAYVDTTPVLSETTRSVENEVPADVQPLLSQYFGRVGLALTAGQESLQLSWETIPDNAPTTPPSATRGDTLKALQALPADTLVAFAGNDSAALLTGVDDALNKLFAAELGSSGQALQVHFSQWLGGELAFGAGRGTLKLRGAGDASSPGLGGATEGFPDVYLVARVRNAALAEQDLAEFDALLNPQRVSVNGRAFRQLEGGPDERLTYGLSGERFYLVGGRLNPVLNVAGNGLLDNPRYQMVQETVSADGVALFADLAGIRALVDDLTPPEDKQGDQFHGAPTRPFVAPLQALAAGWRPDQDGSAHGKLMLKVTR